LVNDFLQSERQKMTYINFNGIDHARNFAKKHKGHKKGYSILITPSGAGRKAQVIIEKTKQYMESELYKVNKYQEEFCKIERALQILM
jgi:hypothetical protein